MFSFVFGFLLKIVPVKFIHIVYSSPDSFSLLWATPVKEYMTIYLSILLLMSIWMASEV